GAPERVRSLAGPREELHEADEADDLTVSHGLFAVMAGVTESRPTLLAIDDLHWADVASLEFVLYVLHRLDELPVAMVMTRRPGPRCGGPLVARSGRPPRSGRRRARPGGGHPRSRRAAATGRRTVRALDRGGHRSSQCPGRRRGAARPRATPVRPSTRPASDRAGH